MERWGSEGKVLGSDSVDGHVEAGAMDCCLLPLMGKRNLGRYLHYLSQAEESDSRSSTPITGPGIWISCWDEAEALR
ncbi:uncharacterized protein LOC143644408 isoform X4 [Tamandua tetradactyla]|uniref:uncharacterized protein LOC143644408 isoform X4 n=1 Tax=Tamandua tetradactyla TaxID=48850 RepID=UPI004054659E